MIPRTLRIIHCFRSPVGGIFRHVRDLVEAQHAEGHEVGILCDSSTGGPFEDAMIAAIAAKVSLGVHRIPMRRAIAPSDLLDFWKIHRLIRSMRPDVLHGHGAKGGAYARLVGSALRLAGGRVARLYTPHGGSLHYDPRAASGRIFFTLERQFERLTDHLLFVSGYEENAYRTKVGAPAISSRVIRNGLTAPEFKPVETRTDAADFIYIGMLRALKGPDLFLEALAHIVLSRPNVSGIVVGAGDQKGELQSFANARLPGRVRFLEPMPARQAFALAKVVVVPSRAESLPYIVVEAIAAGRPIVATDVGGIAEIIPPALQRLVPSNDSRRLAADMLQRLEEDGVHPRLLAHVRTNFSVETMAGETMAAYRRALVGQVSRKQAGPSPRRRRVAPPPQAAKPSKES